MKLEAYEYEPPDLYWAIEYLSCPLCKKKDAYTYSFSQGDNQFMDHECGATGEKYTIAVKRRAKGDIGGVLIDDHTIQCGSCKKIYDIFQSPSGLAACAVLHGNGKRCLACDCHGAGNYIGYVLP